jgi:Fe-S-cluster containining protein
MASAAPSAFQSGRILGPQDRFQFGCHPGVACFTRCCRDADMYLYPYDVIRMKRHLGLSSEVFLETHAVIAIRDNPHFPHVMLKMSDAADRACPFLAADGCRVYPDRPYACRAYPLERAVSRDPRGGVRMAYYGIARHAHCLGHAEPQAWTVSEWAADQGLAAFEAHNDRWVDVDSLLRTNPWGAQGLQSPALSMAFMACYNVDKFRRFVLESTFLTRFAVPDARVAEIRTSDEALMHLGFDWVRRLLRNQGPLAEASDSAGA